MIASVAEEGLPLRQCLGDSCALFVRLWKPKVWEGAGDKYTDQEVYQVYEGCGLIQQVPWAQQEYKKKTTSEIQAGEESEEEVRT